MNKQGVGFVCGRGTVVGVWEDRDGFKLRACGDHECVRGYTFVRPHRVKHEKPR